MSIEKRIERIEAILDARGLDWDYPRVEDEPAKKPEPKRKSLARNCKIKKRNSERPKMMSRKNSLLCMSLLGLVGCASQPQVVHKSMQVPALPLEIHNPASPMQANLSDRLLQLLSTSQPPYALHRPLCGGYWRRSRLPVRWR